MAVLAVDPKGKRDEFALHKTLLNCLGVTFLKDETKIRKLHLLLLIFVVASYSAIELWELIANVDDFDIVTNIILHLIGFYMGITKMLLLFLQADKLNVVLRELEDGELSVTQDEYEEKLVVQCTMKTNKQIKYCFGPLYVVFILSAIFAMSTRLIFSDRSKWTLPFTQITIIDVKKSPNFEMIWFHQTLAFIVATCAYLICEVMITSVLAHLCIQCKIVAHRVEKTAAQAEAPVARHVGLYGWSARIQEAFSLIVFVVFGSDVLIICFSAFHASLFPLSDAQCVRDLGIAVSVSVKTLIVCYYGNEVTLESESLTTVCFHTHVRVWDRSYHKALLMMIKKSQVPIQIAAGNFIPISLSTFIWIIRSSYSYFAVLRSRNDAISS